MAQFNGIKWLTTAAVIFFALLIVFITYDNLASTGTVPFITIAGFIAFAVLVVFVLRFYQSTGSGALDLDRVLPSIAGIVGATYFLLKGPELLSFSIASEATTLKNVAGGIFSQFPIFSILVSLSIIIYFHKPYRMRFKKIIKKVI